MGPPDGRHELVEAVEPVTVEVLGRLGLQGVDVDLALPAPDPAGQQPQGPVGHPRILYRQQAGPVTRDLRLAVPFEQSQRHRPAGRAHHRARWAYQLQQQEQQGAVQGVLAHDVGHLVAQREAELARARQLDQRAVDHDERLVHPHRPGVGQRGLRHVERRHLGVEHGAHRFQFPQEVGILARPHPQGLGLVVDPDVALAEHAHHLADHGVEAGDGPQRTEGGPVGGMFPRRRADAGQGDGHRGYLRGHAALTRLGDPTTGCGCDRPSGRAEE